MRAASLFGSATAKHRASRRQNGVELARNHDAFEAAPHRDDVQIAGHHHVRHLLDRAKRQESEHSANRCTDAWSMGAVRPITYEHEPGIFVAQEFARL